MKKLFSLTEYRQIQAKFMIWLRAVANFAFPSLVRRMRMKAAIADNSILCYLAKGCVADVVYFSSQHQRSGKSYKGDSGKRNEDDSSAEYLVWMGFFIISIVVFILVCRLALQGRL